MPPLFHSIGLSLIVVSSSLDVEGLNVQPPLPSQADRIHMDVTHGYSDASKETGGCFGLYTLVSVVDWRGWHEKLFECVSINLSLSIYPANLPFQTTVWVRRRYFIDARYSLDTGSGKDQTRSLVVSIWAKLIADLNLKYRGWWGCVSNNRKF
ncbi:hypothetical protein QCA50_011241 [Cerrena zonata]|uniref:Uncharacterized protein n=1 Tax=Cerrena zonata TaxID=2478898 RepID=A0AAW0FWD9_9APHY